MICSAFCLCSQASTSSHLKDIITFRAPLFIGSVARYHPSGYRSNAGMNMNYLKHSLNYLAFNWRLCLEAEGATFVPLLVDKKSLSPIPLFLWNNETVSCLWRVSQVQAVLSSCFRDLNGMKMVLYLLYFMFCLHKASEGLSLFFFRKELNQETCSGFWVLISDQSASQASQCALPNCIRPFSSFILFCSYFIFHLYEKWRTYPHGTVVMLNALQDWCIQRNTDQGNNQD